MLLHTDRTVVLLHTDRTVVLLHTDRTVVLLHTDRTVVLLHTDRQWCYYTRTEHGRPGEITHLYIHRVGHKLSAIRELEV